MKKSINSSSDRWLMLLVGALYIFILIMATNEFQRVTSTTGEILIISTLKRKLFIYCLYLVIPLVIALMISLVLPKDRILPYLNGIVKSLRKYSLTGFACLIVVTGFIYVITFSGLNKTFSGPYLRLTLLLPVILVAAWFSPWPQKASFVSRFSLWLVGGMCLFLILVRLTGVTDYVFSLGWSEGDNLWMNSTLFSNRPEQVSAAYFPKTAPAAYGLNGLWFLLPGVPIWFHRLWLAFLDIVPPFLLMLAIVAPLSNKPLKLGIILGGVLFLNQGQIYPHLMIAGTLVIGVRSRKLLPRFLAVITAGYFATASRWSWIFAPAYWSVLIELFYFYPERLGNMPRRLMQAIALGAAGVLSGLLFVLPNKVVIDDIFQKRAEALLWYRLFPSATSGGIGLLGLALIAFFPLTLFLVWMGIRNRWKLDWVGQILVFFGLFLTFVAGMVVSVKIGGGGNLHNWDMFIITLLIIAGFAVENLQATVLSEFLKRSLVIPLLLVAMFLSLCWFTVNTPSQRIPLPEVTKSQLETIRTAIVKASSTGEVLFLTQRQLMIFNTFRSVKTVDSYDKVVLLEFAMAGDAAYFQHFYNDLAGRRFSLIVTDPMPLNIQGSKHESGEENDIWIKWVGIPVLESYQLETDFYPHLNLWLLIPNEGP